MSGLKVLTMMQLKDKIDMSYLKSVKKTIFKVVMSVLKFGIITALIWLGFYLLDFLNLVSLLPGIPQEFLTVIFTLMLILSMIVCTYGLMKSLYFGKDNQLLLTLPVKRATIFTSKLVVYYLYELLRNLTFILPLLVAYAVTNAMPISFWLWLIPAYFVLTAVPVVVGALLSIPAMLIAIILKNNKWLQYPLVAVSIAAIVLVLVAIISVIPANFDLFGNWGTTFWKIQDFMNNFCDTFLPFTFVVEFMVGSRYGIRNTMFTGTQLYTALVLILALVAILTVTYVVVRPLFFKMASVPFEFKKIKTNKLFQNQKHGPVRSIVGKERKMLFRDAGQLFALIAIAIALPISILLLNKIFAAMDTDLTGMNMAVAFNILLILLIALSSNARLSYIHSEEGASSYLNKTVPQPFIKLLFSKLIINMLTMTVSIIATVVVMAYFQDYTFLQGLQLFGMIELLYLSHMLMSAEFDIMNPQTAHYQTTGTHSNNPNENKSTIFAFLISALFAYLTFFFIDESTIKVWFKLMIFAGIFFAIRLWLYVNKIKVYYKEK